MSEMTDKEDNEIYPQAKARDKKRNEILELFTYDVDSWRDE